MLIRPAVNLRVNISEKLCASTKKCWNTGYSWSHRKKGEGWPSGVQWVETGNCVHEEECVFNVGKWYSWFFLFGLNPKERLDHFLLIAKSMFKTKFVFLDSNSGVTVFCMLSSPVCVSVCPDTFLSLTTVTVTPGLRLNKLLSVSAWLDSLSPHLSLCRKPCAWFPSTPRCMFLCLCVFGWGWGWRAI